MQIITGKQPKPMKAVIYGPEGVGKSTLASQFPKPLFVDVEGGTSQLDVARTPRPTTWAHLKQIIRDLATDQMGFETLVIDTADWAERLAIYQVCATNNCTSLGGNNDFGASYNQLADMWGQLLTGLEADFIDAGKMNVVFLAHSSTRKFELPDEKGQFDRYELKLEKKVSPLLKEWASLLLFVNYKTVVILDANGKTAKAQGGTRRVMYSEHCAAFDAKNRDGLPKEMPMDIAQLAPCFTAQITQLTGATGATAFTPKQAEKFTQDTHNQLADLLHGANISYDELLALIVERGKYPAGTPMENLAEDFIKGYIFHNWEKIVSTINNKKEVAA